MPPPTLNSEEPVIQMCNKCWLNLCNGYVCSSFSGRDYSKVCLQIAERWWYAPIFA